MRTSLLAVLLLASPLHADVITVGPAGDHTQIQAAVNAAVNGDIVLVAAGTYASVTITGKSLVVAAAGAGPVLVSGNVVVQGLPAGGAVVLRGIDVTVPSGNEAALSVLDCDGVVVVEDGVFVARNLSFSCLGCEATAGVRASFADAVTLLRCSAEGGDGGWSVDWFKTLFPPGVGGPGVFSRSSSVAVEGCVLAGGVGGGCDVSEPMNGAAGGSGLRVQNGLVFVAGSTLTGGQGGGGDCDLFSCGSGGPGGAGLHALNAGTFALERANALTGAFDAPPYAPPGEPTQTAPSLASGGASILGLSAGARGFVASSPAAAGTDLVLAFDGQPGDPLALLFVSLAPSWAWVPGLQGVLQVDLGPSALLAEVLVPLDPAGDLTAPILVPPLGLEGLALFLQPVYLSASSALVLGPSSATVLTDL